MYIYIYVCTCIDILILYIYIYMAMKYNAYSGLFEILLSHILWMHRVVSAF